MATEDVASQILSQFGLPAWALALIVIWTLAWKGIALWTASKKDSKIWFIVILVLNTLGILEILYIFLFSKIQLSKSPASRKKRK